MGSIFAYAIRSTFHTTIKATPEQLVFGRDMVLPITLLADWGAIDNNAKNKWLIIIEEKMLPE
jgi:hypothetical protein